MPRAIDHLVIASHDLEAQAAFYRRLGFQVGARNRHPWGTENHIVQFDGAFLELIGLGQGFAAPAPQAGVFSFPGFISGFLARRQGLAMLAMRSADAEADRKVFAAEGLGDFVRFDFARKAQRADGGEADVAFSLAFAACPAIADAGFFVCEHKFPENFWSRAAQIHANGAVAVSGVTLVHERPEEAASFLLRFARAAQLRAIPEGCVVGDDGADLECVTPRGFEQRYGADIIAADGPPLALARIGVADLRDVESILDQSHIARRRVGDLVLVAAPDAFGLALAFEAKPPASSPPHAL